MFWCYPQKIFQEFRGRGGEKKSHCLLLLSIHTTKANTSQGSRYSAPHNKAAAMQERLGSWHSPWGEMLPWKDPLLLGLQTPSSLLECLRVSWSGMGHLCHLCYLTMVVLVVQWNTCRRSESNSFLVEKEGLLGRGFSAQLLKANIGCNGTVPYPRCLKQFNFPFRE